MPPRRPSRPPVPLSRDRILATALALADREGLEHLTMRSLGEALSVEAMSLYRYVAGKDDVLAGIADLVVGEFEVPAAKGDWREGFRRVADSVWRVTERHPNVVPLLLRTPSDTPSARRFAERMLELIGAAGFAPAEAHRIYRACQAYALGSAMVIRASPSAAEVRRLVRELREAGTTPLLAQALAESRGIDRRADYDLGFELMITALGERRGRRAGRDRA